MNVILPAIGEWLRSTDSKDAVYFDKAQKTIVNGYKVETSDESSF